MVSYQWTVRSKRVIGRLTIGAWVEIVKTNTTAKPTPLEIFRAFESKYGMKIPQFRPINVSRSLKISDIKISLWLTNVV